MVSILLLSLILVVVPLVKTHSRLGGAFVLKEVLFQIISIVYLCYLLLSGFVLPDSYVTYSMLLFITYITASTIWSTNIEQSWRDVAKWVSLFGLFLMVSSVQKDTALTISMIPIPFFLLWAYLQHYGKEPFDGQVRQFLVDHEKENSAFSAFLGSIGNSNHTAAFLAPYLFIDLYLIIHVSMWFWIILPFLAYGIYLTRCYGAMIGVALGLCFIYPPYSLYALLIIPLGICALFYLSTYQTALYDKIIGSKEKSLMARMIYIKICYRLWKKRPVFGWGLTSFRKEVYETQAEMNVEDPTLLGYKESENGKTINPRYMPYPTRAHNDYLEMLADGGAIGFSLLLFLVASIVYGAAVSHNYLLLGGLVCLMVHGFFFYTLSTFSYVPYIVLVACSSQLVPMPFHIPIPLAIILTLVFIKLAKEYIINPYISIIWITKSNAVPQMIEKQLRPLMDRKLDLEAKKNSMTERDSAIVEYEIRQIDKEAKDHLDSCTSIRNEYVDKAVKLTSDGHTLNAAFAVKSPNDPYMALYYAERAIHHFDGLLRLPVLWGAYGELQKHVGNWEGAKRSFRYSLYLDPCFYQARTILRTMQDEEDKVIERNAQITRLVKPGRA